MSECQEMFRLQDGECVHYLFPPSIHSIIGSVLLGLIGGLSSLAGLGGGGPALAVLLTFFNFNPKDATILVFASILGTTLGNIMSQMQKALNGKVLIQYRYAFVSMPIMFLGSFVGVMINKLFPSTFIILIIIACTGVSLPKIYARFLTQHAKQTQQNAESHEDAHVINETTVNPFDSTENVLIFKRIGLIISIFFVLSIIRGSNRFPSLLGVEVCSPTYWTLYILSFLMVAYFAYSNMQLLHLWAAPKQDLSEELVPFDNAVQTNIQEITIKSLSAGIFSGFGLGGGIFLVPMFRNMGCSPLQATASCCFTIVNTAFINCLQGIFIGVIGIPEFLYFVSFSGCGSFFISRWISSELQKRNRLSYVEGLLFLLLLVACINIPISLIVKYVRSNYDNQLLFGFGSLC